MLKLVWSPIFLINAICFSISYLCIFTFIFLLRYKVIVRVIDDTGSASLLLYEDIILKLIDIPCSKLKAKYGDQADDIFPDELAPIVGKKLLFRFLYSSYNINFNNHVYQVKMISHDEDMIKTFKHGFINEVL